MDHWRSPRRQVHTHTTTPIAAGALLGPLSFPNRGLVNPDEVLALELRGPVPYVPQPKETCTTNLRPR